MAVESVTGLSAEEIVELSRKYTLYEWSAQSAADPIPVDRAEGVYFYTPDGRRFLDFNSQLMSVNIGHGDKRVVEAIKAQADKLAYVNPFMAHEPRAKLGKKLAEIAPGDIDVFFFTNGGAEANENAIKLARQAPVVEDARALSLVPRRDRPGHRRDRRSAPLGGRDRLWGVVRVPDSQPWGERGSAAGRRAAARDRGDHPVRGSADDRRVHRRAGRRDQRHPHPARRLPAGHPRDLRPLRHLVIADEVMTGFGRTGALVGRRSLGRRAGPDHDGQGPDVGVPAAGRGRHAPHIAEQFRDKVFYGGLTYNSHPMGCAAALATIAVYEEDGLIERAEHMGEVMRGHHQRLMAKHPRSARCATSACSG